MSDDNPWAAFDPHRTRSWVSEYVREIVEGLEPPPVFMHPEQFRALQASYDGPIKALPPQPTFVGVDHGAPEGDRGLAVVYVRRSLGVADE